MEKDFYKRLSPNIKKHYDELEKKRPHTDRFKELMNRTEMIDEYVYFTSEERDYLGKEDLPTFEDLFETDAYCYMED